MLPVKSHVGVAKPFLEHKIQPYNSRQLLQLPEPHYVPQDFFPSGDQSPPPVRHRKC